VDGFVSTAFRPSCGGGGGASAPSSDGPPTIVSGSPAEASGAEQTYAVEFSNPSGADKILMAQLIITPNLSSPQSCWVEYAIPDGTVKMMDGSGQAKAGEAGSLSNSQCTIDPAQVKHTIDGKSLKVSMRVQLKPSVVDTQNVYALTSTASQHSTWTPVGTWTRAAASAK